VCDEPDHGAGASYVVSDEMLRRFAESTTLQRLRWLEDMRRFTWNAATEETRRRWRAERDRARGLPSDV
jgi:hypothetical protein